MGQRLAHRLLVAHDRIDRPVHGLGALLGGVLQAQLERIHAELLGQLVEHALDGIGADRSAGRAIGRDLGAVGDDVVAQRVGVRDVVGPEGAAGGAADRRAGEGTGLQPVGPLAGDDGSIFLGADLDLAHRARGRAGGAEHFLARHHHLDRPARLPGQHQRQRLEVDDRLAAEAATDLGRDGADVALLHAGQQGGHGADHELALTRAPDRGLAIDDADQAGVRLDVALVHGRCLELALDDHVGVLETRFDVTLLVLEGAGDVRGLALELDVVVKDGRVRLHRVLDVDRPGQHLVVDLDQLQGLGGDRLGGGRDGGHRMAVEQRLVARHDIAAHPAHVLDAQHHRPLVDREIDDVLGRHHRHDAWQLLGLGRVDRPDAGVRVRAAQHLAPDHAGHGRVGGIGSPPCHLVGAVGARGALADPLVVGVLGGHGRSSLNVR